MILTCVSPLAVAFAVTMAAQSGGSTTETYTYDARGQLVDVQRSGGVNHGIRTEYTYDAAFNRIRKKVTGA
jgi:hypothetical protein